MHEYNGIRTFFVGGDMDQSEIFRLLLVVLLLANKQLSPTSEQTERTSFDYTAVNDVLILTMLLRLFDAPGETNDQRFTTF